MRGSHFLTACTLALAVQACTLAIPAGLVGTATPTTPTGKASTSPATSACDMTFDKYDADKSGAWSQAEFSAYFATLPKTEIACLDPKDNTKTITCPQHDPVVMFKRADVNGDGKVGRDEQCASKPSGPMTDPAVDPNTSVSSPIMPNPGDGASTPGFPGKGIAIGEPNPSTPGSKPGIPGAKPPVGPRPDQPGSECADRMARADANQDGTVDLAEFQRADYRDPPPPDMAMAAVMPSPAELEKVFRSKDLDQNGKLEAGELCANASTPVDHGPGLVNQPDPPKLSDSCQKQFTEWDKDRTGALSYDEYAEGKWSQIRFIRAPSDEEVKNMKQGFRDEAKKADTNGDGKLPPAEFGPTCQQ